MAAGAIPVLVVLIGAAVDYARLEDARARLQHAADAAVLAVTQAQVLELDDAVAQADPLIDANFQVGRARIIERNVEGHGVGHAEVFLRAEVDMFFLELVGYDTMEVAVYSEARFSNAPDVEITVFFDNSASMLIGATPTDIAAFEQMYGCAFACHYPITGFPATYEDALTSGYTTRLDVARASLLRAFDIADASTQSGLSEVYFDIRTFAYGPREVVRATAAELVGSVGNVVRAIGPAPPDYSGNHYAATDYEAAFAMSADVLAKVEAYPERNHFVLFITDGVADYYRERRVYRRGRPRTVGQRLITPFDPDLCDEMKAAGVKIGVIYTTYFDIPHESFWVTYVKPFSDQIGPMLSECATPGWYFEAEYAEDIDKAFLALIQLAMPKPQLTQ